ncbi:hypothetical protein SeLEV6574_g03908 [Synchytrium endobioticum]|uniref:2-(3-amino-3-carboxypropyl)histidine synthase subunit 2 n=1 Tax=Synchytrium endobioticum TaxID=286115 RepID=A0A507D1Y6_9FUNG|nr:hypothetical protein SeLEV6574_g03908 [Synchytrium endobioticum]
MSVLNDYGRAVIERAIDTSSSPSVAPSALILRKLYDVDRTIELIREHDYRNIALQFPDELLHISTFIADELRNATGKNVFILADTSYGACCVDDCAAEHALTDYLVHYGRACLSPTRRLPVQYVFGQDPVNVDDVMQNLNQLLEADADRRVLVLYDVVYHHCIASIKQRLDTVKYPNLVLSTVESERITSTGSGCSGRQYVLKENSSINDYTIFYIGPESLTLTNIIVTHPSSTVIAYNPGTQICQVQSPQVSRLLKRRYFMLQKAKDADVFGILVGTLGVASYLPVINSVKALIKSKSKKSYTVAVGKPNPAKLGNFLEIECFVLVACPENSLIDSKEFLRPIVTPFELELALNGQDGEWVGRDMAYVTDLDKMRIKLEASLNICGSSGGSIGCTGMDSGNEDDDPHFSLVTGKYKQVKKYTVSNHSDGIEHVSSGSTVVVRNQDTALTVDAGNSAALDFLHQRTYQGLDARIRQTEVSTVRIEGRSGIARGYAGEGVPRADANDSAFGAWT